MSNLEPITRKEQYLNRLTGEEQAIPETPVTRTEQYLAKLCGEETEIPSSPITREEAYLAYLNGENVTLPEPITRLEQFMAVAAGKSETKPTPLTREEFYWNKYQGGAVLKDFPGLPASIVTVTDALAKPLDSLKVAITPVQDLHGYANPWPAGAGKNKLPLNVNNIKANNTKGTWSGNAYTESGVTFTLLTDNSGNITGVKTNGTASANIYFVLSYGELNWITFDGSYVVNGCTNGSSTTYAIQVYSNESVNVRIDNFNQDKYIQSSSSTYTIKSVMIVIRNGYTASNLMFYPMIRLISVTDSTFAPYSNICPIIGWDEVNVTVADDVDNPTVENIYTIDLNGTRYGGKVDLVSGVLTVDRYYQNLGGLTWVKITNERGDFFVASALPNIKTPDNSICSQYKLKNPYSSNNDAIFYAYQGGISCNVLVRDSRYTDTTTFKTAMSGVQLVYELATPLTIQLTPTEVQMLLGTNNIWADTGDILEGKYYGKKSSATRAMLNTLRDAGEITPTEEPEESDER